ncbi:biotin transporter BioY [Pseudodesulfovibrio sediminis]|uniref:Biotin transporter n=1 Tax=Pseudodesulfovibrio sediminis TaxID=2810563 RepID=A0ABM7P6F5_9BACT|nr:biotin transporter BioY [Pseudodesulfovibrio sediminis]BCS88528.1 biotin biosynthesis protein BioY [Pseudodesulfovibrio sediminis]
MHKTSLADLHQLVWTALMAALIGAGAYIYVPIGPVPVSMQTFFVTLAGFVLGPKRGMLAVGLYLLAGTIGLPVFAGGTSGLGHLLGPTGGFLIGFMLSAMICGIARKQNEGVTWVRGIIFGLLGMVALFVVGAGWLKFSLDFTWMKSWSVAVAPFLVWGAIKTAAALATCRYLTKFNLLPVHA